MLQTKVIFNVLNKKNKQLRVIDVVVDNGEDFMERATAEAQKSINAEKEHVECEHFEPFVPDSEKVQPPAKAESKTKFSFDFEFYHNGVQKRTETLSANNDDEGAALEEVVAEISAKLTDGETYRYTGNFKKEVVE